MTLHVKNEIYLTKYTRLYQDSDGVWYLDNGDNVICLDKEMLDKMMAHIHEIDETTKRL